jgi:fructan beta-fructosidase|tara:strand:- start:6062 stop:6439 length:378 start_codon:yes stop_codon:yes gene_type:complete
MDERSQWFGLSPRGVPSVLSILSRGYRMGAQQFILDRSLSGKTSFDEDFVKNIQTMPIPDLHNGECEVRIVMDWSSVEIFINRGQYVMTCRIFPNEFYRTLLISNPGEMELKLKEFSISPIKSIW